jgi:hypothetical protein
MQRRGGVTKVKTDTEKNGVSFSEEKESQREAWVCPLTTQAKWQGPEMGSYGVFRRPCCSSQ